MCVSVTDRAAVFIKRMVRFSQGSPASGFRLAVKPGGCSGFSYEFSVEAAPAPEERVVETDGVRLFLPPDTCELLKGRTIDYAETRLESGFTFKMPGAVENCGCGAGTGPGAGQAKVVLIRPGATCAKPPG